MIFVAGIITIPFKKYNDIIDYNKFIRSIFICLFAAIARIIDQTIKNHWYFYLHAIWHIGMTIGLVQLIDSLAW